MSKNLTSDTNLESANKQDVNQLRNELRTEIRENTREILNAVGQSIDSIDERLGKLENHTKKTDAQMIRFENKFNAIDQRFDAIEAKISNLPTKDEFYGYLDRMFGEYQTFQQESIIITGRVSDHEVRIGELEKTLLD